MFKISKKRSCINTHHFEILWSAFRPTKTARQHHVPDVMTCSVVKLSHVKWPWLEVVEVSFDLEGLKNTFFHHVLVPDLIPDGFKRIRGIRFSQSPAVSDAINIQFPASGFYVI